MVATTTPILSVVFTVLALLTPARAFYRGLAWAVDDNYAPALASGPQIHWYYHWADGPNSKMPSNVEFVPMFYGPNNWDQWNQRVSEMHKKTPKHILGPNEPDISGTYIDPHYAATLFMEQIYPWAKKGVKLGSPAIAFDLNWMNTFYNAVKSKGGHVDFFVCHWYGSWNNISQFKKLVTAVHSQFGKPVWVTEVGITTGSNPSQQQVKNFMMNAFVWMAGRGYVQRASWFGCFTNTNPPDGFATGKNAFFKNGGKLTDMGYWYRDTSHVDRRLVPSRHFIDARADADDDVPESTSEPEHCDARCQQIEQALALHEATFGPINTDD
jgi:hypothetical protein